MVEKPAETIGTSLEKTCRQSYNCVIRSVVGVILSSLIKPMRIVTKHIGTLLVLVVGVVDTRLMQMVKK